LMQDHICRAPFEISWIGHNKEKKKYLALRSLHIDASPGAKLDVDL